LLFIYRELFSDFTDISASVSSQVVAKFIQQPGIDVPLTIQQPGIDVPLTIEQLVIDVPLTIPQPAIAVPPTAQQPGIDVPLPIQPDSHSYEHPVDSVLLHINESAIVRTTFRLL